MADDDRAPAQTLVDLIERRRHDHRVGLVLHDHVWTWAGAVAESDRWGAAIDAAIGPTPPNGVRHLGLLVENTPEYLLALLGAARRGITTVGLNTTRRGAELERDIAHTDCGVVLADAAGAPLLGGLDLGPASVFDVSGDGWLVGKDNIEARVSWNGGSPKVHVRVLDATDAAGPPATSSSTASTGSS